MPSASIFISSVQREFAAERQALKAFIEGDPLLRRFFSAFIFEGLPARDERADHAYLDAVEQCAVYVGIFGHEYGSEDADGISPHAARVRARHTTGQAATGLCQTGRAGRATPEDGGLDTRG